MKRNWNGTFFNMKQIWNWNGVENEAENKWNGMKLKK